MVELDEHSGGVTAQWDARPSRSSRWALLNVVAVAPAQATVVRGRIVLKLSSDPAARIELPVYCRVDPDYAE